MTSVAPQVAPKPPSEAKPPGWIGKAAFALVSTASLTVVLMWLAGVFHPKVPNEPAKARVVDVSTIPTAEVRTIRKPRVESAVGTIKAVHEAAVASRILARVLEVKVKAGQAVQQDEVLVRLDDSDLLARVKQSEANLQSAKANRDNSAVEFARAKQLLAARAMSQQEFDRVATTFRTAEAELNRAGQATQEAKAMLSFATIKAPLTGVVIDKKIEVGDTATPGQTLLTLFNPSKMQMLASVRESLALKLKVGQKIPGRIESFDHECEATISEIVPEAQAASRSFTVKVVGPCPPGVYSGMLGRIYIPLEDETILVAPAAAVRRVGQLEMVDIVADNTLRRRNIQTGRILGNDVEVLSGLQAGEKVALPAASKEATR